MSYKLIITPDNNKVNVLFLKSDDPHWKSFSVKETDHDKLINLLLATLKANYEITE